MKRASGYNRRLVIQRSWVRIPDSDTGWIHHIFVVKLIRLVKIQTKFFPIQPNFDSFVPIVPLVSIVTVKISFKNPPSQCPFTSFNGIAYPRSSVAIIVEDAGWIEHVFKIPDNLSLNGKLHPSDSQRLQSQSKECLPQALSCMRQTLNTTTTRWKTFTHYTCYIVSL